MNKETQTVTSNSNYITVCNDKAGAFKKCFELMLDAEGKLSMETLHVQFPSATAIKYKNPETGIMRILTQDKGRISAPPEGWGKLQFTIVNPVQQDPTKRGAVNDSLLGQPASKQGRALLQSPPSTYPQHMTPGPRFPLPSQLIDGAPRMPMMAPQRGPAPHAAFGGPMGRPQDSFIMGPQQQDFGFADDTFPLMGVAPMGAGGMDFSSPNFTTYCEVCDLSFVNGMQSKMHFESKRHADFVLSRGTAMAGGGMSLGFTGNAAFPLMNRGPRPRGGMAGRGRQRGGGGRSFLSPAANGRPKSFAGIKVRGGANKSSPNKKVAAVASGRSFANDEHSSAGGFQKF